MYVQSTLLYGWRPACYNVKLDFIVYCPLIFFIYFHRQSKLRVRKHFTFFSKKNTGLNFCKFLVINRTAFSRISRKENNCINYTENFGKFCIVNFCSISVSSKTFQNFGLNGALVVNSTVYGFAGDFSTEFVSVSDTALSVWHTMYFVNQL